MLPIKTLLGPFPGVSCHCHTCSGSHMPRKPFTNCSLADGRAGYGCAAGETGIHRLCLFSGCSQQQRKGEESWHPPWQHCLCTVSLCKRLETFLYLVTVLGLSHKPVFSCRNCFYLMLSCLKVVGNGASVLVRWRPSLLPGRRYWFVLVAFPASRGGQSALKAKRENLSSEGAEIYCSMKCKMYASAFGVTLALPLSVWGGARALNSALICSMEV